MDRISTGMTNATKKLALKEFLGDRRKDKKILKEEREKAKE